MRCSACGETHTLLQPELGPHKRYRIDVLEQVCTAIEEGATKSEASRRVGGPSLERIGAWVRDWSIQAQILIYFIKLWLLSGPRPPLGKYTFARTNFSYSAKMTLPSLSKSGFPKPFMTFIGSVLE